MSPFFGIPYVYNNNQARELNSGLKEIILLILNGGRSYKVAFVG